MPDAVLLDIRLPGIDGWAVLEALKQEPDTRDIPVIVVSIVEERARGAALGRRGSTWSSRSAGRSCWRHCGDVGALVPDVGQPRRN